MPILSYFLLICGLFHGTIAAQEFSKEGKTTSSNRIPAPFAPPSAEFCENNKLGDDMYFSILKPCNFIFYKSSSFTGSGGLGDHFSCGDILQEEGVIIATEMRRVVEWPDSCVAVGPRCYSIEDHPSLVNFTLFSGDGDVVNDEDYAMTFPPDADIVSVDCTADYEAVQEVAQNLPEELQNVAGAFVFFGVVVLISTIAFIVTCCMCCFKKSNYHPIGIAQYYNGPPVPAYRVTQSKSYAVSGIV
jgi:hypothetical protein